MITWTSRQVAALSIVTMLGACDATDQSNPLLAGLKPPRDASLPPVPLVQAEMMSGKVTLVPPAGYCIDPESLSQSFALMARCDNMGAATGGTGAPTGVLTVSVSRRTAGTPLPTAQDVTAAAGLGAPQGTRRGPSSVIFSTTGAAPAPDLSPKHWRALAQVEGFVLGAALFGPEGLRAVSDEGAEILEDMIARTIAKTAAD
jgi:hypothetical protein